MGTLVFAVRLWNDDGLRQDWPRMIDISALGRGAEAVMVLWLLLAVPAGALVQSAVAPFRRARLGAGWALAGAYLLLGVVLVAAAWQVEGMFPDTGARGKSGGMYGAFLLIALAPPAFVACSGVLFVRRGDEARGGDEARETLVSLLLWPAGIALGCAGFFAALAATRELPPDGGSVVHAVAALGGGGVLGGAAACALCAGVFAGEREWLLKAAVALARPGAAVLVLGAVVGQLGWLVPGRFLPVVGVPALVGAYAFLVRRTPLRAWLWPPTGVSGQRA